MALSRRDALVGLVLLAACKRRPRPARPDASVDASVAAGDAGDASAASPEGGAAGVEAGAGALYRTATGGFQVRFPDGKAPEVEEKTITGGGSAVHLFKVQYGTSGYIVTYDDLGKSGSRTAQQILDGAREGVLETTGGTVEREGPFSVNGHPGLELAVTATTSGITMRQRVRVLLVSGRLYQLIVVAPSWSGATVMEQEFFDSFTLLSDGGT